MSRWIADIVVCLAFYFVYHKFFIKYCKQQWIEEISQKVTEALKGRTMDDVKYEYGCEVTSTKECPLREEIRAEVIDEFKKYLLSHRRLVRDFETRNLYDAIKIEYVSDTTLDELKEQKK